MEVHQICFRLGGYFMTAVLAAASYSRGGCARHVMVPGVSTFHLEPRTIITLWTQEEKNRF